MISPDLGTGIAGAAADGSATIDFPWDMAMVNKLSVKAIDAAGNMSQATEFDFDQLSEPATYAPRVEAESVIEDTPASRHVTNHGWSGDTAVNLVIPAGQTATTTVQLPMPEVSADWQAELVLTDETTSGTKLTPRVNGRTFRIQDPWHPGDPLIDFSTVLSGGNHSMVTPIFDRLDNRQDEGLPTGSSIEFGLVLECPAGGSDCVVSADVFQLKRSEGSAALDTPVPQDAVRVGQDTFYARTDEGRLLVDAPGADLVTAVAGGTTLTATSATTVFELQLPAGNVTAQLS